MGLIRRDTEPVVDEMHSAVPCFETLGKQLGDPDPEIRRKAALGLDGVAKVVPALLERLDVETEPAVRDAVLTTLAGHDSAAVAEGLVKHLASEDTALRMAVVEALSEMSGSVCALMPGLVADPDPDVRIMTVMVLANTRHPEAESWIVALIRDDPHHNVVTAAIDALLPSARAEHTALLRQAMARFPDDPFLRFTVEKALPRLTETSR